MITGDKRFDRRKLLLTALVGGVALSAAIYVLNPVSLFSPPRTVIHTSGPEYRSLEELFAFADLVVIGTVQDVFLREEDEGGEPDLEGAGVPMAFHAIDVSAVLKPAATSDLTQIAVATFDSNVLTVEGEDPLVKGQELVLALLRRDQKSAPGIEGIDEFYVLISGDNGVLDVTDGEAHARAPAMQHLTAEDAAREGDTEGTTERETGASFDLTDVFEVAGAVSVGGS